VYGASVTSRRRWRRRREWHGAVLRGRGTLGIRSLVSGKASVSTSSLSAGTHVITATYGGDGNYSASTGTLSGGQTVNQASTTTALATSGVRRCMGRV